MLGKGHRKNGKFWNFPPKMHVIGVFFALVKVDNASRSKQRPNVVFVNEVRMIEV